MRTPCRMGRPRPRSFAERRRCARGGSLAHPDHRPPRRSRLRARCCTPRTPAREMRRVMRPEAGSIRVRRRVAVERPDRAIARGDGGHGSVDAEHRPDSACLRIHADRPAPAPCTRPMPNLGSSASVIVGQYGPAPAHALIAMAPGRRPLPAADACATSTPPTTNAAIHRRMPRRYAAPPTTATRDRRSRCALAASRHLPRGMVLQT